MEWGYFEPASPMEKLDKLTRTKVESGTVYHYNTIHIINSVIISLPVSQNSPKILVQQMYSA